MLSQDLTPLIPTSCI